MDGIKYWNSVVQVSHSSPSACFEGLTRYLQFVMGAIVVATFLFSMGNKPKA